MSNMLYILGASLAQEIGKDEILCRGLLRMTLINSVQHLREMADPIQATRETTTYITKMTYQDWEAIIKSPALAQNLAKIGVKDTSTPTSQLMQALIEQQSLFTMAAH